MAHILHFSCFFLLGPSIILDYVPKTIKNSFKMTNFQPLFMSNKLKRLFLIMMYGSSDWLPLTRTQTHTVNPSIHPSIYLSIDSSIHPPINPSNASFHQSVHPSFNHSIRLFMNPFTHLSIYQSIHPLFHLSVYPSIRLSVHATSPVQTDLRSC